MAGGTVGQAGEAVVLLLPVRVLFVGPLNKPRASVNKAETINDNAFPACDKTFHCRVDCSFRRGRSWVVMRRAGTGASSNGPDGMQTTTAGAAVGGAAGAVDILTAVVVGEQKLNLLLFPF